MSLDTYLRFVLALAGVIALIFAIAWIARRSGFGPAIAKPLGRRRRLSVIETLTLDPKRRLVIIRRDGVEHLLLLGSTAETVVERGIAPPEPFALPESQAVSA